MKYNRLFPIFLSTILCCAACSASGEKGSFVTLRSNSYTFSSTPSEGAGEKTFTLKTTIDIADFQDDHDLFSLDDILSVRLRQHSPTEIRRQNYPAAPMPDGRVPVLETALKLQLPDGCTPVREGQPSLQPMVVGVPLAMLDRPWGRHDLVLNFTGVTWDMYVDGRLVDRDYALGYPLDLPLALRKSGEVEVITPCVQPTVVDEKKPHRAQVQYFTPEGHNAWVGDVATIWHRGRYHIFYLLDRRGHESKFGRGGHYFEHLSTADFRTWTEHEAAAPIEEQWETLGTGTPFVWHDSLFLSYGMHTSRVWPSERTATPAQWQYINEQGESQAIPFAHPFTADEAVPSGASYSVSSDGVADFHKSHVMIHPAENPTIYTDADGRLCMLANYGARGMWTSDRLDGGWRCLSENFPPGGDCTFIFRWGAYDYIVGGFTHMWMKRASDGIEAYTDMVARGEDFYDGLSVPSICELPDGRHLMAGWVEVNRHWGGPLVIRELVQHPDGRIGSRFMPELMPLTRGKARTVTRELPGEANLTTTVENPSFMLTFTAEPTADGSLSLDFMNGEEQSESDCRWTLDIGALQARFGDGRTLREGGQPQHARNYAIGNLRGLDAPFTVRIIVRGEPKLGGSLIDVEIAGQRTMISHRSALRVGALQCQTQGVKIRDMKMQTLQ